MIVYRTPGKNAKRILKHPKWLLNLLNVYQSIIDAHVCITYKNYMRIGLEYELYGHYLIVFSICRSC